MAEWISAKEQLPDFGEKVIIAFPSSGGNGYTIDMGWCVDDGSGHHSWYSVGFEIHHDIVTHWMPMPDPPEDITA